MIKFDPTLSLGSILVSSTLIIALVINNRFILKKFLELEAKVDSLIERLNRAGV